MMCVCCAVGRSLGGILKYYSKYYSTRSPRVGDSGTGSEHENSRRLACMDDDTVTATLDLLMMMIVDGAIENKRRLVWACRAEDPCLKERVVGGSFEFAPVVD